MIILRKSNERGQANHGWLKSYHTFSFSDYYDPRHMNFSTLRVINEDWVEPSRGFATHPHNNMEIITYVLEGELEHKDSMGNGSIIRAGDVQKMSAGTGVTHSEANPSSKDPVHLLQIWIMPNKKGIPPAYEQKHFTEEEKKNKLLLIASYNKSENTVSIEQDANLYAGIFDAGFKYEKKLEKNRHHWLHVVKGNLEANGQKLETGDAIGIDQEDNLSIKATRKSELLFFDLA